MKFLVGDDQKEIIKNLVLDSFPQELIDQDIWMHYAIINDDSVDISAIISVYDNKVTPNKYNEGVIFVSNKILNDFPCAQSFWSMKYNINRMYTDVAYRSKGIAVGSVSVNDVVARELGYEVWSAIYAKDDKGRDLNTKAGDQLNNHIYSLGFKKEKIEIDLEDIFQFRNYCYPIVYMDKRLVYRENI